MSPPEFESMVAEATSRIAAEGALARAQMRMAWERERAELEATLKRTITAIHELRAEVLALQLEADRIARFHIGAPV